MRARSGWARALAMRASEVSPDGRAVFEIVGADLGIVDDQPTGVSSRNPGRFVNFSSSRGLSALEMEHGELGRDGALRGTVAPRGALGGDRQRLLIGLGQQLVELLERLLVELQRRARQHDLRIVERAGVGGRGEVADQLPDRLPGELAAQLRRQGPPLGVVEVRARGGLVEVLERAAARLRAYKLYTVVIAQHAHVVGDDAERSVELDGQVPGTGDALAESLEDAGAQRMRERFGDP